MVTFRVKLGVKISLPLGFFPNAGIFVLNPASESQVLKLKEGFDIIRSVIIAVAPQSGLEKRLVLEATPNPLP